MQSAEITDIFSVSSPACCMLFPFLWDIRLTKVHRIEEKNRSPCFSDCESYILLTGDATPFIRTRAHNYYEM